VHLDVVAVALGVVPLLLGGGWALETAIRARVGPEAHAFALLVVATVTLLTLEVGSFVESFGLGIPVKDRYLFYVTPLLVVAAAVALVSPRVPAAGVVAVTGFMVATVGWEEFGPVLYLNIDSPASATHERLTRLALELGLSASTLVAIVVGVVGPALVLSLSALPRRAVATVVLAGIVAAVGLETGYTWARALSGIALTARPTSANSWIDHAVPTGADVGMLPYAVSQDWFPNAIAWWNIEFWNARVTRAYLVGDWFTYTPDEFPRPRLGIDAQGRIVGNPPPFLVRTTLDARFAPAGVRVGSAPYLEVVRLEQPPRAAWVTRGLAPDGWTRPHVPAVLRVFGNGPVDVRIRLSAPGVKLPRTYEVGGASGALASNEFTDVSFRVCAHAHVDVPIHTQGTSAVRMIATRPPYADDFRFVGLRVSKIATAPVNGSCSRNNTSKLR
jgi:hypothetical protein